jgi:hypothetical protein
MNYEQKYLKYKAKYLSLKREIMMYNNSLNITEQSNQTLLDNNTQLGGATHRLNFFRKHNLEEKNYSLKELSRISKVPLSILQEVYNRGSGAYKTNRTSVRMKGSFKKNVNAPYRMKLSKEQWSYARVYSFLDGNPKHDTDLRKKMKNKNK